jgi:hypothetical protein
MLRVSALAVQGPFSAFYDRPLDVDAHALNVLCQNLRQAAQLGDSDGLRQNEGNTLPISHNPEPRRVNTPTRQRLAKRLN